MIGGGAKKPVERAFGAAGDSRRSRRAVSRQSTQSVLARWCLTDSKEAPKALVARGIAKEKTSRRSRRSYSNPYSANPVPYELDDAAIAALTECGSRMP
jgi:hypothetical protein